MNSENSGDTKKLTANRWFAAFLGLIFPPSAFLYLSKPKWALIYFGLSVLAGSIDLFLTLTIGYSVFALCLSIVCCIHSFRSAKNVHYEKGRKWYSTWWGALSIPVAFLAFTFVLRSFFFEPFQQPSESMSPTLSVGDYFFVSKWGYGNYRYFGNKLPNLGATWRSPNRGEIFVFYPPHDERPYIKRVIGLPNDRVRFEDKQLYINDERVETAPTGDTKIYVETLDEGQYSVQYQTMDNPYREFETVVPENMYFLMGDNRDNSSDSRIWGFVPRQNMVGKLTYVW